MPETAPKPGPIAAFNGNRHVPPPVNEPIKPYAPGSPEKAEIKSRLKQMAGERIEMPLVIGGREVRTGETAPTVMPHDHAHVLGQWHRARRQDVEAAIAAAGEAHREWSTWSWEDRAAVFLKAAELLATTWRSTLNAATMLGQSKTVFQAEIDAACELIDFWRFNPFYAEQLYGEQPLSDHAMWNQLEYRPLEGFVYAVTPFNFTSIGGNLPAAPALMGNTVLWKPASSAMLSAWYIVRLLEEAGLPPGVINFVPGDAAMISEVALSHRDLAGVHFTGSTAVFNSMWKTIGAGMSRYRSYPRIVGETGGKDFIVAHASADPQALAVAIVRGGFEYQGQKCSAVSRVYIPRSIWPDVRDRAVSMLREIKMGDVADFRNFMGAVIDKRAFEKIGEYLAEARRSARIVHGGNAHGEKGWFIEPTLVETDDPVVPAAVRGDLRPGGHRPRLRRRPLGGDASGRRLDLTLRAHRRRLRPGPPGPARGLIGPPARRRQLLHQRQADRRRRRPAAVRRSAVVRHQRQGGVQAQPRTLGQRAHDQGDVLPATILHVPVHGRGVATTSAPTAP